MAIEIPCAGDVFAQMETEVLDAIKTIATTAKQGLTALKTQKQALTASLNISLIPLQIKKTALETLISAARNKTQVIPSDLVLQCPQLGAINTTFEAALLGQLEGVQNIVFDIERLISEKTQTESQIAQLDAGSEFLDAVIASIDEVLSTA